MCSACHKVEELEEGPATLKARRFVLCAQDQTISPVYQSRKPVLMPQLVLPLPAPTIVHCKLLTTCWNYHTHFYSRTLPPTLLWSASPHPWSCPCFLERITLFLVTIVGHFARTHLLKAYLTSKSEVTGAWWQVCAFSHQIVDKSDRKSLH